METELGFRKVLCEELEEDCIKAEEKAELFEEQAADAERLREEGERWKEEQQKWLANHDALKRRIADLTQQSEAARQTIVWHTCRSSY
jgi:hypothetical protein